MAMNEQPSKSEKKQAFGFQRLAPLVGRIAFLIVIVFLIVYMITVLTGSGSFFADAAERSALVHFDGDLSRADRLARVHYDNLYKIAERVQYAKTELEVQDVIREYIGSDDFGDLRIYAQGKTYSAEYVEIIEEHFGTAQIEALSKAQREGCSGIYYDGLVKQDCIAFFVPVRGSVHADGLLSILPARGVVETEDIRSPISSVTVLISPDGTILSSACDKAFPESTGNDFYKFLNKLTHDKAAVEPISDAVHAGKKIARTLETPGGQYTVVMSPVDSFDGTLILVNVIESELLVSSETVYIRHIINLTVIAITALVIGCVYAFFYYRKTRQVIDNASYNDAAVGCPNAERFRAVVAQNLQNRQHRYALIVFDVRRYRYLSEHMQESELNEMLGQIAKIIETFCSVQETYGYLGGGKFGLQLLYEDDRSVRDRVRLIEAVVNKHPILGAGQVKRIFNVGVSLSGDTKRYTALELVNHATVAAERAKGDINLPYVLYSEQVNAEREKNERIEAEMESALASNEFRLFLQPKYNIAEDRIDSAEALVRWFDPKTGDYRFPGEFISLFESNGFITKLDHFMYLEVLKCLATAAERGEKVVPISVNVSLVTANSKDFLDFYIENKKKYRIVDGFITVEFTESFAMGDHQKFREITNRLHANGIRTSLDDFGSGYASFSVLKDIPIDELKLDRLFLSSGLNREHDEKLLETVITLAKSLGMRVVQEGVETKEMFESVCAKGCDVIQGYYYAKAIPVEEYRLFIASNTSIKYKSLVK